MIEEAQAHAEGAINLTSGEVHHGGVLRQLLSAGCEWQDILDAIDSVAASMRSRGQRINSWAIVVERATQNRLRREHGDYAGSDHPTGFRRARRNGITPLAYTG